MHCYIILAEKGTKIICNSYKRYTKELRIYQSLWKEVAEIAMSVILFIIKFLSINKHITTIYAHIITMLNKNKRLHSF